MELAPIGTSFGLSSPHQTIRWLATSPQLDRVPRHNIRFCDCTCATYRACSSTIWQSCKIFATGEIGSGDNRFSTQLLTDITDSDEHIPCSSLVGIMVVCAVALVRLQITPSLSLIAFHLSTTICSFTRRFVSYWMGKLIMVAGHSEDSTIALCPTMRFLGSGHSEILQRGRYWWALSKLRSAAKWLCSMS